MIEVTRDEKEGLGMLCLQDIEGCVTVGQRGNIRSYCDNMQEFPREVIWPQAND